jgi:histidyl-tRNA synthetase
MKFKRPRGTNDFFGDRMERWRWAEGLLAAYLRRCGYREIRTPIFESTDLFTRAVGEGTDIVRKEMYTFADRKGRSLTLRPENTAPVMRAYIENGLYRNAGISRFFYLGPMFRYDRPQAGRYRQFHQIGAEAIGSPGPAVDAEIIDVSLGLYRTLGFPPLEVRLNSVGCPTCRTRFRDVLTARLADLTGELCEACRERTTVNPLRIFDCKECGPVKAKLPFIADHLCDECRNHFSRLERMLDEMSVSYVTDPLLVRGLDYYTRTAFEIIHPGLGAQNALCGGGRYDGLAEECGGPPIPAVGFSAGMERLMEVVPKEPVGWKKEREAGVYFAVLDDRMASQAIAAARGLRERGIAALVDLSGRGLKRQLKAASEAGAVLSIIVGLAELPPGSAAIKRMETGEQTTVGSIDLVSRIETELEHVDGGRSD